MPQIKSVALIAACGLAVAPGLARGQAAADPPQESRIHSVKRGATEIVSQPARDIGASKRTIPPVLAAAARAPYAVADVRTCPQIAAAMHALTAVLGPDFVVGATYHENRAGKIAQEGGETVVNSLIPFRGLVREVSGAAPAQRRFDAAINAGLARRGFLHGLYLARSCAKGD